MKKQGTKINTAIRIKECGVPTFAVDTGKISPRELAQAVDDKIAELRGLSENDDKTTL